MNLLLHLLKFGQFKAIHISPRWGFTLGKDSTFYTHTAPLGLKMLR